MENKGTKELRKLLKYFSNMSIEEYNKLYNNCEYLPREFQIVLNEMSGKSEPSKPRFDIPDIGDVMWKAEIKSDCLCPECKDTLCKGEVELEDKPQFTEEQFNEIYEAQGNALVGSGLHAEALKNMKQKGYLIPVKSEEPLIVHNVMSWKGKNYLKQLNNNKGCTGCDFHTEEIGKPQKCTDAVHISGVIWKSFEDIEITDELACTRKDIGDIYITYNIRTTIELQVFKFMGISDTILLIQDGRVACPIKSYRLATAEELQEYFKEN